MFSNVRAAETVQPRELPEHAIALLVKPEAAKFARAVPAPLRPRPLVEESKLNRGHAARGERKPDKLDGASGNVSSSRSHVWHSWERSRMSGAQLKRIGNYQLSVCAGHKPQPQPTTKYIEPTRCASSLSTSTSPARKLHKQVTDNCDTLKPFICCRRQSCRDGRLMEPDDQQSMMMMATQDSMLQQAKQMPTSMSGSLNKSSTNC